MIRTIHIADGTPVVLRKGFDQQTDQQGRPVAGPNGEPVYVAEAVVAGSITSRFAVDNDRPDGVRLKVNGNNPGHGPGTVVRLEGRVTLTAWYSPRARGNDARSDITITAERVTHAHGATPVVRGGIPAVFPPEVTITLLGQTGDGEVDAMLSADSSYVVDGVPQIRCTSTVPDHLLFQPVRPVDLRAFYVAPDREDVSQRSKSELVLTCVAFEPAAGDPTPQNGRNRRNDPAPAPEPAPAEAA